MNFDEALSMNREILISVKTTTHWFHVKSQSCYLQISLPAFAKTIAVKFWIGELRQLRVGKNVAN